MAKIAMLLFLYFLKNWQKEFINSFSGTSYGVIPDFDAIAKLNIYYV
jgi:hypothetical protein